MIKSDGIGSQSSLHRIFIMLIMKKKVYLVVLLLWVIVGLVLIGLGKLNWITYLAFLVVINAGAFLTRR